MDELAVGGGAGGEGRGRIRVGEGDFEEAKRGDGVESKAAEHGGEETVGDAELERLYGGEPFEG